MEFNFLDEVHVSAVLSRQTTYKGDVRWKVWREIASSFDAVVIGKRIVSNGISRDWYGEGYIYKPKDKFEAFLVVKDMRSKPTLVKADAMLKVSK